MFYGGLRRLLAEPWDLVHCWEEPYVTACAEVAALARADTPSCLQRSRTWRSGIRLRSAGSSGVCFGEPTDGLRLVARFTKLSSPGADMPTSRRG